MNIPSDNQGTKVGKRYSSYADEYDKLNKDDHFDDQNVFHFLKQLQKGVKILDLGCGSGIHVKLIRQKDFDVVGIDTSSKLLKIAKKRNPDNEFHLMDVTNLMLPDSSFEGALSLYVLDHLPSDLIITTLEEVYRVLKNKGLFLLILHEGDFEGEKVDLMDPRKKLFRNFKPRSWLEEKMKNIGFKIIHSQSNPFPKDGVSESTDKQSVIIGEKRN